jgi:deazaflavin-dependent oxidoreductase (nitroreductase family)
MQDGTAKTLSTLHSALYRLTGGRVGRRLVDNDMLLLTTTGRRSGRAHTVPLLYLRDGISLIVIASWGGRPRHPHWYVNLCHRPSAEVQILDERLTVEAETLSTEERADWWPRIVAAYDGYADYQSRTHRQIPVVRLTPV